MSQRMVMTISAGNMSILYKRYKLPGYGKKCPDKDTDKCYTCRYSKAEMSGYDATRLLRRKK